MKLRYYHLLHTTHLTVTWCAPSAWDFPGSWWGSAERYSDGHVYFCVLGLEVSIT